MSFNHTGTPGRPVKDPGVGKMGLPYTLAAEPELQKPLLKRLVSGGSWGMTSWAGIFKQDAEFRGTLVMLSKVSIYLFLI